MDVLPLNVQEKVVETNGAFLICFADEQMLETFRNHPTTISIDGTHGTCSAKFILISILVFGKSRFPLRKCKVTSYDFFAKTCFLQMIVAKEALFFNV